MLPEGGRGIGAATARALAESGARIVVTARSVDQIEKVKDELRQAGLEVWAVACDVTDADQVVALAEQSRELVGPVQILVNNAGIASSAPLKHLALEEWNRLLAVNATGPFLCTQAFMPGMVETGWGRVINVASIAGKIGAPYISGYCASKHAVVGFTRAVAAEVAAKGVTVNAVCPGYVDTPMTEQSVATISAKTGLSETEGAAASALDESAESSDRARGSCLSDRQAVRAGGEGNQRPSYRAGWRMVQT